MSVIVNTEDRLYQTVAAVLGVEVEALAEESSFETLPNWDSLNHLNLVMALESEFGVSLSADDALNMRNVGAMRAVLRRHGMEV